MGEERDLAACLRQVIEGGHGRFHFVSHPMHVYEEMRRLLAQDDAPEEADHRLPPDSRSSLSLRARPCTWHRATASASALSACSSPLKPSRTFTMCCTCSLLAPPLPTTESFTSRGVYSCSGTGRTRVPQMAAARACPSLSALSAFLCTKARST